jgi:hypothetical protein
MFMFTSRGFRVRHINARRQRELHHARRDVDFGRLEICYAKFVEKTLAPPDA